jgi:hypothetical protein
MIQGVNKGGDSYRPFQPKSDHIVSHAPLPHFVERIGSLYFPRMRSEHETHELDTISGYQVWVENGWKEEHGTYAASQRFLGKLREEAEETFVADANLERTGFDPESKEADELLGELGDVLWCATAIASNSAADIDASMKGLMAQNILGLGFKVGNQNVEQPWRQAACDMLTNFRDLKFSNITGLLQHDFEPKQSTLVNIDEPDEDELWYHVQLGIKDSHMTLGGVLSRQFMYGEADNGETYQTNFDGWSPVVGEFVAQIYLEVAYVAWKRLGKTLDNVTTKNMAKIENRINAGRVDKSDGTRTQSLL